MIDMLKRVWYTLKALPSVYKKENSLSDVWLMSAFLVDSGFRDVMEVL